MSGYVHRALIVTGNRLVRPSTRRTYGTRDELDAVFDTHALANSAMGLGDPLAFIEYAHIVAEFLFAGTNQVTPLMDPELNGEATFAILPSGSKVGKEEDERDVATRERFLTWVEGVRQAYGESGPFRWVAVEYGERDDGYAIVDSDRHRWAGEDDEDEVLTSSTDQGD